MDLSSCAKADEAVITHLEWTATVDFDDCYIWGKSTFTIQNKNATAKKIFLDTKDLRIHSVLDSNSMPLEYKLHPSNLEKPHLGRPLEITLPTLPEEMESDGDDSNSSGMDTSVQIVVTYQTTKESSALQWLPPSQTAGKKHPYVFTQCQAIHARSLLPCQDSCGIKFTYRATVTVPQWATCVMSAVHKQTITTTKESVSIWEQTVPISAYLFALCVGNLTKRTISDRCAIWSEPEMIDAAAYEFAETEQFLQIAETLAGNPYVWKRYDLLCLPPSFPYGGMENPCLTFVTPTLLAGDRSLAGVVAHEIAHSWTGNLVTNASWDHFWLNEGWTKWFERKIMERFHKNPKFLDFDAIGGQISLKNACESMPDPFTKLVLEVEDKDPDDSYSIVSYEKGFTFLLYLERAIVGTEKFEQFFQAYLAKFASKTLTSNDFKDFFLSHFEGHEKLKEIDWDTWFHAPGMPPILIPLDQSMALDSKQLAKAWVAVDTDDTESKIPDTNITKWSSAQITCFLDELLTLTAQKPLKSTTLTLLSERYQFASTKNSEILFRYCKLAIAAEDQSILPVAIQFVTSQGRMKFTRPLYKSLYNSKMGKDLAVDTFLKFKDVYHPICTKMVASDLRVSVGKTSQDETRNVKIFWIGGAIVAGMIAVAAMTTMRGKKMK